MKVGAGEPVLGLENDSVGLEWNPAPDRFDNMQTILPDRPSREPHRVGHTTMYEPYDLSYRLDTEMEPKVFWAVV